MYPETGCTRETELVRAERTSVVIRDPGPPTRGLVVVGKTVFCPRRHHTPGSVFAGLVVERSKHGVRAVPAR